MRALAIISLVFLAACMGRSKGGRDWVQIAIDDATPAEAKQRADRWCVHNGFRVAVKEESSDVRYHEFKCRK